MREKFIGPVSTKNKRTMLAVLPFENLGTAEDQYFAAGMTDEITSRLSTVPELGVISRTSAMQYEKSNKSLKQIGDELGVEYVLEGSIRWNRSSNTSKVRVTPQLVRVADDTQIWSDTYDKVINDVFQVQSEIAQNVITQLGITLLEPQKANLTKAPTQNVEAYQYFLRGHELIYSPSYDLDVWNEAIRNFEKALELDPNFTVARAQLAFTHLAMFHEGYDTSPERLKLCKDLIDKAIEADPNLPDARVALGYYHYFGFRDYQRALQEFHAAFSISPKTDTLAAIAFVERRQGKFEDSISHFKKAIELDPRNANIASEVAIVLSRNRRYQEAEAYFDKAIGLDPQQVYVYGMKQLNCLLWKGDIKEGRRILVGMPEKELPFYNSFWFSQELYERKYEAALDRLNRIPIELFQEESRFRPKSLLRASVLSLMGKDALARLEFEKSITFLEAQAKERSENAAVFISLGKAYAGLGRKEDAIREGKKALEMVPLSIDRFMGPHYLMDMAEIFTMVGEYDQALNQIETLLGIPSAFSVKMLNVAPIWDPLRTHPRYKDLITKYSKS